MKRFLILAITALFLLALLAFTVTYTVRFNEAAVLTTFGSATDDSTTDKPGLKFKWPYPIQSVTKYDRRTRFVQGRGQSHMTADEQLIVVESFCTWRVTNPLLFFQRFSGRGDRADDHYKAAELIIQDRLRSASAEVSGYRMDDLFSGEVGGSRLSELESVMLRAVNGTAGEGAEPLTSYGIEATTVGLNNIVFSEQTTEKVFERMTARQDLLATAAQTQGEALAQTIESAAEADAQKILAFARSRADEIRAVGTREAAQYLEQMNEHPELAMYLLELDLLRGMLTRRTTLVLPGFPPGSSLLSPDALQGLRPGEIPPAALTHSWFKDEDLDVGRRIVPTSIEGDEVESAPVTEGTK